MIQPSIHERSGTAGARPRSPDLAFDGLAGLAEADAASRLELEGPNALPEGAKRGLLAIGLEVIREPMFLMLVAAGSVYLLASADHAIELDPFQIHQALLNVILNALDATPAGGRVRLESAATPSGAVFSVENSGPAVPPDMVARLAEPFVTSKPSGTGLGLAIATSIARAHGGDLTLARNEPGRVRFELHIAAPRGTAT